MHPAVSQLKSTLRSTLAGVSGYSSCIFAQEGTNPPFPVSGKILITEKYDFQYLQDNETDHSLSGKVSFTFLVSPEDFAALQTFLTSVEDAFLSSSGSFGTNSVWIFRSISGESVSFKDGFFHTVLTIVFQVRKS